MEYTNLLLNGFILTLIVAIISFIFGLLLSFIFLKALESRIKLIKWMVSYMLFLLRSIPEIIILFVTYYGLEWILLNILKISASISPIYAGVFSLSLLFSCYVSQIFYDANKQISRGQIDAARLLGLGKLTLFYSIRLRPFLRAVLPGVGNYWLILLKDTALLSLIGIQDFFSQSQLVAKSTNQFFYYYLIVLVTYLFLSGISEFILQKIKYHIDRPWSFS